jgi:1-acyl-sn-glycerol-3-phosphate acyltransferase
MTLRALLFNIVFYLNLAALLVGGLVLLVMPRHIAMKGLKLWSRSTMFWQRLIVGTRVELRGLEHLPPGPVLIAAKHQSAWETVTLHAFFDDPAIVLKKELMWVPIMGWLCRKFALIPVDRTASTSAMRALRRHARRARDNGRQIIIFPEGTRRAPGAIPDYKPGVALLYGDLGIPCVPLALNSGLYWPRRKPERYPGTIIVELQPAIPPGLPRKDFMARLGRDIETASARLIEEAARSATPPPLAREMMAAKDRAGQTSAAS